MIISRILLLAICFGSLGNVLALGLSETNHGIYLVFAAWRSDSRNPFVSTEPFRFDDRLMWGAFMDGSNMELCYPAPPFGVRIEMTGPDGKEVAKTALGRTFGSKWDKLRSFKDGKLGHTDTRKALDLRGGGFSGVPFLAPEDLFRVDEPGIYTLEIQMQMFRHTASPDPEVWHTNLMRFSPVKIKVEKPTDAKPGKAPK